jgi:L-cysteine/cystine lyase
LEEARPTLIGWRSLSNEGEAGSGFHQDARRFEVATSCTPLLCGLATSLELLDAVGSETERLDQIRQRSRQLWQGLQGIAGIHPLLPEPPPAGLVSFLVDDAAPDSVVRQLGEQGVWLRSLDDPHCLRACTHITTTSEEVERLLAALDPGPSLKKPPAGSR